MLLPGRSNSSTGAPEPKSYSAGDTLKAERFEMTIDERIERLTERHEALAQSVEILRDTVHETSATVNALGGMMAQLLGVMKTLAETVQDHERRITGIEGAPS
jgi:uncharacterized coiled-coil protein SlyX